MGVPLNHPFTDGFSIINHSFWGNPIFENRHIFEAHLDVFFDFLDDALIF